MSFAEREGVPHFGRDYDLERWSNGETDAEGKFIWHETYPAEGEWGDVRLVTLNFDPEGEGDYRNYHIAPERPLDPWGEDLDNPDHYDLDDLALQAFLAYGFEF